jgi:hypothetical protein
VTAQLESTWMNLYGSPVTLTENETMAARTLRPKHSDEIRAKIQASMLVNALQDNVTGKKKLNAGQIKSAEILLRKSVPDLTATELSGMVEHDI